MAYRFTNTDKWTDSWFCELKPLGKLLFLYLCDQCDIAGFLQINIRKMAFDLGTDKQGVKRALSEVESRIEYSVCEKYLYIRNFIKNQRNFPLKPENKAHLAIIRRLNEMKHLFGNETVDCFFEGVSIPLAGGFSICNGKSDSTKSKDIEKGVAGGKTCDEKINADYESFISRLHKDCPRVCKLDRPVSEDEFMRLSERFSKKEIWNVFEQMENRRDLLKRYSWAYRTALNWLERGKHDKISERL